MRSWTAWNPALLLPRPSEVVMEQPSMLQRSVRHELTVKSSTFSRRGSYFERRTTQAPQPPSPQPSLTLLKGVLLRKKSMSVVEGSMEERSISNLSPLTAKTKRGLALHRFFFLLCHFLLTHWIYISVLYSVQSKI